MSDMPYSDRRAMLSSSKLPLPYLQPVCQCTTGYLLEVVSLLAGDVNPVWSACGTLPVLLARESTIEKLRSKEF